MIHVEQLTVTYPNKKGVFEISFKVQPGQICGYLGPNGAGKTTTIRALMGFMRPDHGLCQIKGLDCFKAAWQVQRFLGYVPGEMAFPDGMSGSSFLSLMRQMRRLKNRGREKALLERFELDPHGKIRHFSKGMKQKLGIVAAFQHDPAVLVLDEPTSGLDPLMQARFVALLLEEKKRGKTILLSSHRFEEVERTCDQIQLIKDGRLIRQSDVQTLQGQRRKGYILTSSQAQALGQDLASAFGPVTWLPGQRVKVFATGEQLDALIGLMARYPITDLEVQTQNLEGLFLHLFSKQEDP